MTADGDSKQAESKMDFWMKVAGISFGLWSIAIGMAIKQVSEFQSQFSTYVLLTERRITLLEERQALVLREQAKHESIHGNGGK